MIYKTPINFKNKLKNEKSKKLIFQIPKKNSFFILFYYH